MFAHKEHSEPIRKYKEEVESIENDGSLDARRKRKKIAKLSLNSKWVTNVSYWWGGDGVKIEEFKFFYEGDIAIGKIKDYKPKEGFVYPKFKKPESLTIGRSLCKLGFPFHTIQTTFEEEKGFLIAKNTFPIPFFPIEGMLTREINCISETNKTNFPIRFLETSSPGLRGQSGGPIFDVEGNIWAVQSKTSHLPLDFSPVVERNGKKVEEHQFLNVGWGVHPEVIAAFLKEHKVHFDITE